MLESNTELYRNKVNYFSVGDGSLHALMCLTKIIITGSPAGLPVIIIINGDGQSSAK